MPEVTYIHRNGKSVLLMDFTHIVDYAVLPGLVDESIRLAHSSTAGHSVLALIDLSGTQISKPVRDSLKRLSKNNGPFIKAIAFVGLGPGWAFLMALFLRVSGRRNHRVVRNREGAIRWLMVQGPRNCY